MIPSQTRESGFTRPTSRMASVYREHRVPDSLLPLKESITKHLSENGIPASYYYFCDSDEESQLLMVASKLENGIPADAIRGTVWGMTSGVPTTFVTPFGYPNEIIGTSVEVNHGPMGFKVDISSSQGSVTLEHHNPPMFQVYAEGGLVRFARIRGRNFWISSNSLHAERKKWGGVNFGEVFERLGMVPFDELFPKEALTYPISWTFMASVPELITGSRQIYAPDAGHITYLGQTPIAWDPNPETSLFSFVEGTSKEYAGNYIGVGLGVGYIPPQHVEFADWKGHIKTILPVHGPVMLPPVEVNSFLLNGYYVDADYQDERARPGEAVTMTLGTTVYVIRPPSLIWRNSLRDSNPDVKPQWNKLACYEFSNWEDFNRNFLQIKTNISELREQYSEGYPWILYTNEKYSFEYKRRLEKEQAELRRVIFLNFLFSVPPATQRKVIDFYDNYTKEREHLISFLKDSRAGKLYFFDPKKTDDSGKRILEAVGTVKTVDVESPPLGKIYQRGVKTLVYDVTDVKVPKGKKLVLLKEPHWRVKQIIEQAIVRTNRSVKNQKNRAEVSSKFNHHLNELLDEERCNTYYQLAQQSKALPGFTKE